MRLRLSRQWCESMNDTIIPLLPALYMAVAAPGVVMSKPSTTT